MQTSARRLGSRACALVVVAFVCVPVVLGQETPPTDPPQARMGHPPGVSSSSNITEARTLVPPGDDDAAADEVTVTTNARIGRPPGSPDEAHASLWQAFVAWLRAQALSVNNQ